MAKRDWPDIGPSKVPDIEVKTPMPPAKPPRKTSEEWREKEIKMQMACKILSGLFSSASGNISSRVLINNTNTCCEIAEEIFNRFNK